MQQRQGIFCMDHPSIINILRSPTQILFFRRVSGAEIRNRDGINVEIVIEGEELCGWAWPEWRDAVNGNPWQPVPRPSIDPSFIEAAQPRPASARPLENSTLSRQLKCGRSVNKFLRSSAGPNLELCQGVTLRGDEWAKLYSLSLFHP